MEWPPLRDITLSYHTLAGNKHGEPTKYSLRGRAAAAKRAGMRYVGFCTMDYVSEHQLRDDAAWLDDQGMKATEGEWLELSNRDILNETVAFHMGQVFGADRINIGFCAEASTPATELATRAREMAQRARDYGQVLAFEPVAFGPYSDVRVIQHIVREAGEPNLGTLLDTWQLARSYWSADVSGIDVSLVKGIQLAGVNYRNPLPAYPRGLFLEAQCERRLPDEGNFPVRDWLRNVIDAGVNTTIACEVISDELRAMTLDAAAEAVAASLGNLLATAPVFVRQASQALAS
jgi:sugar phosphate isomerase/epimerase